MGLIIKVLLVPDGSLTCWCSLTARNASYRLGSNTLFYLMSDIPNNKYYCFTSTVLFVDTQHVAHRCFPFLICPQEQPTSAPSRPQLNLLDEMSSCSVCGLCSVDHWLGVLSRNRRHCKETSNGKVSFFSLHSNSV